LAMNSTRISPWDRETAGRPHAVVGTSSSMFEGVNVGIAFDNKWVKRFLAGGGWR